MPILRMATTATLPSDAESASKLHIEHHEAEEEEDEDAE